MNVANVIPSFGTGARYREQQDQQAHQMGEELALLDHRDPLAPPAKLVLVPLDPPE